ncbi:ROK family protein, partial [Streptomyces sp. NPDC059411]
MKHVIALDVGGTGMKAALVAADGTLLHEARRATGRERGADAGGETGLGSTSPSPRAGSRARGA